MINFLDVDSNPHAMFEFAAPSCSPMKPTSDTPLTPTPRPKIGSFKSLFVTSNRVVVPTTCKFPAMVVFPVSLFTMSVSVWAAVFPSTVPDAKTTFVAVTFWDANTFPST